MNYNRSMTFYTRKGDDGTTGLLGEGRIPNIICGSKLWEPWTNSTRRWGWRAPGTGPRSAPLMLDVQRDLYRLMAEVAAAPENATQFHFDEETCAMDRGSD